MCCILHVVLLLNGRYLNVVSFKLSSSAEDVRGHAPYHGSIQGSGNGLVLPVELDVTN